ncbi:TPM domain-containing protein [Streptomyces sp. NPDC051976]|uniref:TPM domain-containing protein n=1 Tax=Streptomyces sp. NPDC051976 TaxID=3154947 RepID=UPI003413FF54
MRRVAGIVAALGALWLVPGVVGAARADDPVTLSRTGAVTDRVAALGGRTAQVTAALDQLYDDRGIQLFVVYVNGFSGRTPQDWANATATSNGLGRRDILLAVATHDRRYAISADQDSGLTPAQLSEVSGAAVEPALRQSDWAGAATGAAYGYDAVLGGRPVTAPAITPGAVDPGGSAASSNGAGDLWVPVVAVGVLGTLMVFAVRRRRGRDGPEIIPSTRPGGRRPRPGERGWGAPRPTPLPELDDQARQVLVATDDAVRTSDEDVGLAAAQVGDEAVKPFVEAVDYARSELAAAFRLRQRLDDGYPADDDATRRQMLDEILSRCTQADRRLDAESEAFDRLRALEAQAPETLERAEARATALPGRIAAAEAALAPAAQAYADSALAPVAGHPARARDLLEFAHTGLDQARPALGIDRSRAAAFLRAAEGALAQAAVLADAVIRRARDLREADNALRDALASASASDEPAAHAVREELAAGRHDPIAALRRVTEATAVRDETGKPGPGETRDATRKPAPGETRDEAEDEAGREAPGRARGVLDSALLTARAEVGAARDLVTTHRGAIGSQARTRLTEAERRLRLADTLATDDPADALPHAQAADRLAREAQSQARRDIDAFPQPADARTPALLGGILLGKPPNSTTPATFGGEATRTRLAATGF